MPEWFDDSDFLARLAEERTGELALFFTSLGLGEAFESPGKGWGRAKRISVALAEASRRGIQDQVIAAARRRFGDEEAKPTEAEEPRKENVSTCFVIQPFDGGAFDKRYDDVYVKAIVDAGLEPYRVDRDPRVSIPIDTIADRIAESDICFADITLDNPNVWFELGLAIAAGKEVVLICEEGRDRFPFDVQHRNVIRYKTDSPRDFEELRKNITARAAAALEQAQGESVIRNLTAAEAIPTVAPEQGLAPHEQAFLVLAAQRMDSEEDFIPASQLRQSMQRAGFNDLAVTLAYRSLVRREMVEAGMEEQFRDDPFPIYRVLEKGFDWLENHRDSLMLRAEANPARRPDDRVSKAASEMDVDDIPF